VIELKHQVTQLLMPRSQMPTAIQNYVCPLTKGVAVAKHAAGCSELVHGSHQPAEVTRVHTVMLARGNACQQLGSGILCAG
jgi:hypothetical protein